MKSGSGGFDVEDFVTKLVTFMGGRKLENQQIEENGEEEDMYDLHTPLEWHKVGRNALAKSRRVPIVGFM
jgi:non-structural maintenance of chromosomes element 4